MTSCRGNILVTDDDPDLRRVLQRTLDALGFNVVEAPNGHAALAQIESRSFDVALLDVNMPGLSGIDTCRQIRQIAPHLQVLMLTVRDREGDKIEALDAGADGYITNPFSIPELAARLRAAVRRSLIAAPNPESRITVGEIELDTVRRTARKAGTLLRLTPKEFELLQLLMSNPGAPIAHSKLLQSVWGSDYGQELEYLRTFVHQLRKKVEKDPSSPEYLLTEHHYGYRFRDLTEAPYSECSSSNGDK